MPPRTSRCNRFRGISDQRRSACLSPSFFSRRFSMKRCTVHTVFEYNRYQIPISYVSFGWKRCAFESQSIAASEQRVGCFTSSGNLHNLNIWENRGISDRLMQNWRCTVPWFARGVQRVEYVARLTERQLTLISSLRANNQLHCDLKLITISLRKIRQICRWLLGDKRDWWNIKSQPETLLNYDKVVITHWKIIIGTCPRFYYLYLEKSVNGVVERWMWLIK